MRRNEEPVELVKDKVSSDELAVKIERTPFLFGKTKQTSINMDESFSFSGRDRDQIKQDPLVVLNQEQSSLIDNNKNTGIFGDKKIQESSAFCSNPPKVAESRL